uniref:ShKT domain-containing protein n=1 Tax=Panagrolaimus superbus TaxID=310955 RepID=A0A914YTD0_9BILA
MQFLEQTEMWGGNGNKMSCNGDAGALAFRICRRTCGFCDFDLYDNEKYSKNCPKINATRLSFMDPFQLLFLVGQK